MVLPPLRVIACINELDKNQDSLRNRCEAKERAAGSGSKPYSRIIFNTRSRVRGFTPGCPLITRDAVERETPASLAICSNVIAIIWSLILFGSASKSHF
jgi:hypothetical protein